MLYYNVFFITYNLYVIESCLISPLADCVRMFQKLSQICDLIIPNTKMFSISLKGFITRINYFNCSPSKFNTKNNNITKYYLLINIDEENTANNIINIKNKGFPV